MSTEFREKRSTALFIAIALVCTLMSGVASATTYYVATNGNDTNSGTSAGSPFLTIQRGVNVASSGDTINVAAGRYNKASGVRATVTIDGKSSLTIVGAVGGSTIIDGSDHTINGGFSGPSGYGVYSITRSYASYGQWDMVAIDMGNGPEVLVTGYADGYSGGTYVPGSLWYWQDHINSGIPNPPGTHSYFDQGDGYATLRGQAFHNASGTYGNLDDNKLYVKCVDDAGAAYNINSYTVKCSRKAIAGNPCGALMLTNSANNNTIQNIQFQNGYCQVMIYASNGAVFDHCIFRSYKTAFKLFTGSGNATVRYSELNVQPFALRSAYTGKHYEFGAQVWKSQKEWGDQDWWGITSDGSSTGGHHFHDNYIHDGWDGICVDSPDTEVDHNLIENMLDDPIDVYGNCSDTTIHDNVSINSQQLTRIRGVDTDAGTAFYFYNNFLLRGPMTEQGFNFSSGVYGTGTCYLYQNTLEGGKTNQCTHGTSLNRGIFCNQSVECTYDNWWLANNLFQGFQWTKNDPASSYEIDWQADYNVYGLNPGFASWTYPGRIDTDFNPDRYIDQPSPNGHTVWSTSTPGYTNYVDTSAAVLNYTTNYNVALGSGSIARNAGYSDLNSLFGLSPGTLPGTMGIDCGALQYGASMPVVPRASGPSLSSLSPSAGPVAGGTSVTLTGSSLTGTTAVKFGGTSASGVVVMSATQVRCTSPAKSAGTYSVVATVGGVDTNGVDYIYAAAPTLSSLSPSSGSTAGGTSVTLTGTNLSGTTAVSFGGTAATGIVNMSATQVRCTSPAHAAGTVSVTATTPGGTTGGVNYIYTVSAPTLSGINPSSGTTAGGTACTLTGTNLTGCSAVSFGGTAGTGIVVDSATQVRCTSPAHAAGTVSVTATTPGGTSNGVNYVYTAGGSSYTTTLSPAADTWVQKTSASTNWGTQVTLRIQKGVTEDKWIYLRFALSSVSGTSVTSAKLQLYRTSGGGLTVAAYSCPTDSWIESGTGSITWNNKPAVGSSLTSTVVGATSAYYTWDITSCINTEFAGDKTATVVLRDDTQANINTYFNSKEAASNKPQLVVISQ